MTNPRPFREVPLAPEVEKIVWQTEAGKAEPLELEWLPTPPPPPRPDLAEPAFHGLAGRFVRTVAPHTEADPLGILGAFLTAFGVAVNRGPHFRIGGDRHGCNLFVILVGPTSEGRKGTAVSEGMRLFRLAGEGCIPPSASGLSSGEGFVHAIRDEVRGLVPIREKGKVVSHDEVVVDSGVSDKRLLVVESELGSVLRRMEREGNSLSALMRQAWDGSDLCTLTKKPLRASDPHVGLVAQITPAELDALQSETDSLNGWANRFMYLSVLRPHLLPNGGGLVDSDLVPLALELREAIEAARTVGEMRRDADAEEAWRRVYPRLTADSPGLFGAVTARAAQNVIRVSLLYALLDRESVVRAPHMAAALAFWEAAKESARTLFGGSLGDRVADDIIAELRGKPDGMTRSELRDFFSRNVSSPRIGTALALLARLGLARGRRETPAGGKGRRAERWFSVEHAKDAVNAGSSPADPPGALLTASTAFSASGTHENAPEGGLP